MTDDTLDAAWAELEATAPPGATIRLTRSGPPWDPEPVYRGEYSIFARGHHATMTGRPHSTAIEALRDFTRGLRETPPL